MNLFTTLDDHVIIRTTKSVYKQVKIAVRDDHLSARIGGGFVMLYTSGTTSNPDMRWVELSTTMEFISGSLGRLVVPPGVKMLEAAQ